MARLPQRRSSRWRTADGRVQARNSASDQAGERIIARSAGTVRVLPGAARSGRPERSPVGSTKASRAYRCGASAAARARNSQPSPTASASIGAPAQRRPICVPTACTASVIRRGVYGRSPRSLRPKPGRSGAKTVRCAL